ncbi:MAG: COG4315 family predicted lipoprotein [Acidothermaceae bacterium]
MQSMARHWITRVVVASATTLLLVSACSSKSSTTGTAAGGGGGGASSAPAGSTSAVTVSVKTGPLGAYLTDAAGRTLYLFAADTGTTSTCTGSCASFWPPLITTGAAQASGQAQSAMLGTTKRGDGTTQVTYNGHPLYYFAQDKSAGQANGQGKNLSGGLWWVVTPSGTAITSSAGSSPASSGSGGAGAWS